jgi:hypothetical protein
VTLVAVALTYFVPNERHSMSAQLLGELTDLPVYVSQVFLQAIVDYLEYK